MGARETQRSGMRDKVASSAGKRGYIRLFLSLPGSAPAYNRSPDDKWLHR